MTEDQARKLEVPIKWNGKANVCVYCGRVPETFYVVTGHDHTDDSIRWCICREAGQYKDEITTLRQRVAELETERDALKQQRDELLAAAEAIEIDAEECLDFDEFTAMLVPIDPYHKLMEAITSIKDGTNVQY